MSRALVALHGLLGTPALFDPLAAKLRGHRVLALALPGHGQPFVAPQDFAATADWLAAQLPAEPVDVVGYSLGGRLALALLAHHPDRVRRAVILSAHPGLALDRDARLAEDEASATFLDAHGLASFVDAWEKKPLFATQARVPPHRLAAQRQARLSHDPRGIAASLRVHGLGRMPDYAEVIAENAGRLVWLVGECDEKFGAIARQLQATTSLAVETIAACGHNPLLEEPVITTARIEAALAEDTIPRPQPSPVPGHKWHAKEQS
jgi:2-succinyl-6-hydroxy-2,4-cyclohexadiene-1-carboxylate synthase